MVTVGQASTGTRRSYLIVWDHLSSNEVGLCRRWASLSPDQLRLSLSMASPGPGLGRPMVRVGQLNGERSRSTWPPGGAYAGTATVP